MNRRVRSAADQNLTILPNCEAAALRRAVATLTCYLSPVIVSHTHRYVFVEVPHTGSTAISEELRENYGGEPVLRKHATYRDFLRTATPQQRTYFAFAAVRNPLDLAVSRYYKMKTKARPILGNADWVAKHGSVVQKMDFRVDRWIERTNADFERFLLRWYYLPFDSWSSLDQKRYNIVLRFESLGADFAAALQMLGIEPVRPLPVANVTPGRDRNYLAYYTPKAVRRAIWVFGPYMEQWSYRFPAEWGDVHPPLWSKLLMRTVRTLRSVYWNYLRFRNPRRPTQLSKCPFTYPKRGMPK